MNKILMSIILITSLVGWALAQDVENGVEMQPGEAVAKSLFEKGFGETWVGGNHSDSSSFGMKFSQHYSTRNGSKVMEKENGVEMKPGEAAAEHLFNHGIGQPWVGGNSPIDMKFFQYFSINKGLDSKKHIEAPKKHEIKDELPTTVYFSYQMQAVPYTQYKTYPTYIDGNALWIQGAASWTQYAQVPQGSSLSMLATSATGGNGYLYEIDPSGILSKNSFYFFPGTNQIAFYADTVGQHILLFIIDSQISNSIVIDVTPYTPPYQYPAPIPIVINGDSTATIVSQNIRGYQVFLDGNYIGTEGMNGDLLDGKFTFTVVGNEYHDVRVFDGQFNYPKNMFFERGGTKIINVEPGMAI